MIYFFVFCFVFIIAGIILFFWCSDEYNDGINNRKSPIPLISFIVILVLFLCGVGLFCQPYEKITTKSITAHNIENGSYIAIQNGIINLNKISGLNFENEEQLTLKISGPEWHGFMYLGTKYEVLKNDKVICLKFADQLP